MTLETVASDVIHAIGYADDVSVLEIIFNNGGIYQYRNVPREVFEQFMSADSKGAYFQENIRDEFEYWRWDADMARFMRAQDKTADEEMQGATE